MNNTKSVGSKMGRHQTIVNHQGGEQTLFSEVRVFGPDGVLKETIGKVELIRRLYLEEGISGAPFASKPSPVPLGTGVCEWCKKTFEKTVRTQKYCKQDSEVDHKRNACYKAHYRAKLKRKEFKLRCKGCGNIFIGTKSRVYCNSPCDANHVIRSQYKSELPKFRNCKLCEQEFKPTNTLNIFCHNPCDANLMKSVNRHSQRLNGDKLALAIQLQSYKDTKAVDVVR